MNLAFVVSGAGNIMGEVLRACLAQGGTLQPYYVPKLVIATRPEIAALEKAKRWKVPVQLWSKADRTSPEGADGTLYALLERHNIDTVALCGCKEKIPEGVATVYRGRMTNIHPGPLDPGWTDTGGPRMFGKRPLHAWLSYQREAGIPRDLHYAETTVQFVDPKLDKGAVILRRSIPVLKSDDTTMILERLRGVELSAQVYALKMLATGGLEDLTREKRLIAGPDAIALFERCRQEAIQVWPHG